MKLLYPTKYKEFLVPDKEAMLNRLKDYTEKAKKFRFVFSGHKPFEGQVKSDGFNIKYIGKTARNYKVELEGELIENGHNTLLKIRTKPTRFGKIYTFIWLLIMTKVIVFTLYLTLR